MVSLTSLWLPIVLSAVLVFLASSVLHMVLTYHRSDYRKLDKEYEVLQAMRAEGVAPGDYSFPCPASPKDMSSPEMIDKYNKGPVGTMTVLPNGPPAMGSYLGKWFAYCVFMSALVAYFAGFVLAPGTGYRTVFRFVSVAAFLGYAGATSMDSIWKGVAWSTSFKHMFDGLVYAFVTAGVFGWLWPE